LLDRRSRSAGLAPTPITFSPFIPPDTYHIVLLADVWDYVDESYENNNIYFLTLYITAGALPAASGDAAGPELDVELPDDIISRFHDDFESGTFDAYIEES
jgi:hypothetical protein